MEKLLTVHDVAEIFGVTKHAIYSWIRDGKFPGGMRFSARTQRWPQAQIEQLVRERSQSTV